MAARKQTPDLLSDVIGTTSIKTPVKKRPTHKASIPVKQQAGKPAYPKEKKALLPQKPLKATFYLSPGTVQALEDIYYHLRKEAAPDRRTRVSKSSIVDDIIQNKAKQLDLSA